MWSFNTPQLLLEKSDRMRGYVPKMTSKSQVNNPLMLLKINERHNFWEREINSFTYFSCFFY